MADKYHMKAARSDAQAENMRELAEENRCFMCYDDLINYDKNRIEFETDHWIITPNAYPYEHTSHHILLISRRHVKDIEDLTKEERADFMEAVVACKKRWKLDSYAVGIRSGDFRYNGASVEHLHGHIVVGERDPKKFDKVRFKMSSHPDV